jgi:hypothetical protein
MEWETPEHIRSQVLKLDNKLLTSEGRFEKIKEMTKLIKEATFDTLEEHYPLISLQDIPNYMI